jgi:hypothetical protein
MIPPALKNKMEILTRLISKAIEYMAKVLVLVYPYIIVVLLLIATIACILALARWIQDRATKRQRQADNIRARRRLNEWPIHED